MVDSGSDVVTIREEVLDSLDLELIGPIKSKGVHASRTKNLYRANMVIGNQTIEIEVNMVKISFQGMAGLPNFILTIPPAYFRHTKYAEGVYNFRRFRSSVHPSVR